MILKNDKDLIERCIDVRLFGATTAVKGKTMTLTGPVQFKYGHSLHRVDPKFIKGTTVMPSRGGSEQGTFTERYILPYSLIAFYGIVNENAAINQNIPLSQEDVDLMLEAIWNGTKNLISTSKFGQMPRVLIIVDYKEPNFYLGELDKRVKFVSEKKDEELRNITDGVIDITNLVDALNEKSELISRIRYKVDELVHLHYQGKPVHIDKELYPSVTLEMLEFLIWRP